MNHQSCHHRYFRTANRARDQDLLSLTYNERGIPRLSPVREEKNLGEIESIFGGEEIIAHADRPLLRGCPISPLVTIVDVVVEVL